VEPLALSRFKQVVVVAGKAYALATRRAFADIDGVQIRCPLKGLHDMGSMIAKLNHATDAGLML
ncbi:MAG: hypothetical protein ACREQD_17550, partial [Candidatus Binataceae bacterium]